MGSNKELLLVHAEMPRQFLSHDVNVMLTPQYYTLKREDIPVKYLYQAKKIAPSLFEGLLEEVGEYSYLVYKEEEQWIFIAYNLGQIRSLLLSKGIQPEKVSKIFFAQQAVDAFTAPMFLGEKEALVVMENTVVVVPRQALKEETKPLTFDDSFTPKTGISIGGGVQGSLLDVTQAALLSTLFILFAAIFFVEGSRYTNSSSEIEEEMQMLLEDHPILQSKIQRESVAQKYTHIETKEKQKRETIKRVSKLIFKGSTLISLTVQDKGFKALFSYTDDAVLKRLQVLAKDEKFAKVKVLNGKKVQIEGAL